jgi:regulator of sigma E protease
MLVGIIIGLIVLIFLVTVHELGHAIVARRNGVVVEEFGIGMPPRAYAKKLKNGILFTLNWLPLGGFVRMKGEYDASDQPGDYGAASYWQKTRILLAGVAVNWLVAVVLFSILAIFGLPKIVDNQFVIASDARINYEPISVSFVGEDGPASQAGIVAGDKLMAVDGQKIESVNQFIDLTKAKKGDEVIVEYLRDTETYMSTVKLGTDQAKGVFGAGLSQSMSTIYATWSAPLVGLGTTVQFSWLTIQGIGQLLYDLVSGLVMQLSFDQSTRDQASASLNSVADSVAGPVGILGVIFPAAGQAGLAQVIFLTAIISLSLAVMNILPIPALDGGRWATMTIYRLLKRKLTKEREESIQMIGFSILIGLTILVTFSDVTKLF